MSTSTFYLCTGFHRSGTSLVAQSLAQGGVKMGDELMGATFSNPLGHVEDMPIVKLHDRVFAVNGTDWRYTGDVPLYKPSWLSDNIRDYLDGKASNGAGYYGVKDPRAVFYLDDWQASTNNELRYVFVYRHWSACVNSILSRASRFLVNTPQPLKANKLNFGFFKQPEMVFNMWLATNRRLLEFYQLHGRNSLLFSQEAFVNDNASIMQLAPKIQLQPEMLSSSHFKPELITKSIPSALMQSVSPDIITQCNELWAQLQITSDVSVDVSAETLSHNWVPVINTSSLEHDDTSLRKLEFNGLTWNELLDFAAKINPNHLTCELVASFMSRSFGSVDDYDSLSEITHKFNFFLFSKLSKMRAMHLASNSWNLVKWNKYCEQQPSWLNLTDDELVQDNPFSTRPVAEYSPDKAQFNILEIDIDDVVSFIESQPTDSAEILITQILLFRVFIDDKPFKKLASLAVEFNLTYLSEFCLIKSLRYDYSADTLMRLGDLYRKDGNGKEALQCFEQGDAIRPNSVPILARLAEVNLFLDNLVEAQQYTSKALNKNEKRPNPIALRCQRELQNRKKSLVQNEHLKHANLTIEYIGDYEKIVEIGRVDAEYGERVDIRNRAAAFILRDNASWLTDGLKNIPKASHPLLQHYIYKQWKSIFPADVVQSNIGITEPNAVVNYPQFKRKQGTHGHGIIIDVANLDLFRQLLNAIYAAAIEADLFIITCFKLESEVRLILEKCNLTKCKVHCFPASAPKVKRWLLSFNSELIDYSSVLYLHTDSEVSVPRVKSEHLLAYWSWLGDEGALTKAFNALEHHSSLALVVPPYHTELLSRDLGAHAISKYVELKKTAEYSSDTSCFLHPAGNMFCYNPQHLQKIVEVEGYEKYGKQFFFALPMLLDKHGLNAKSVNEI
ncbi:hypothetical protein J3L16_00385 [Alteromonas sp. 5E99-2]|uniref:hypothetical protein n=1 Tax=Alteromonas sp. 5E99-2 TaxID=2817683 RepID=UPI001A98F0CA|nr:hypothetical protein [Alteromonas sp. 5E99-2]MBO1254134.1 hypothetical protein [Alteromonas sp. 5E99-2]